jgi:ABC-type transport system substrate-binding protein
MVRNPNYWDPKRIPKSDRLVLLPMPDANTRVAALLSGQIDWVEAPPPDAIPRLKQAGMQIGAFVTVRVRRSCTIQNRRAATPHTIRPTGRYLAAPPLT